VGAVAETILIADHRVPISRARIAQVRELLSDWEVLADPQPDELKAKLGQLQIGFGSTHARLLKGEAPALRWLQLGGAGANRLFLDGHPPHFVTTNARGGHAVPISEHLLAMMLALCRQLPAAHGAQAQREWWRPEDTDLRELAGARVVVIGLGATGNRLAALAAAHDMLVDGVRLHPERGPGAAGRVVGIDHLDELLPAADHVVLTLPLTTQTHHLFGAAQLALMKPTALLFNSGRGEVIDEAALTRCLVEGRLGGAGLDVFAPEPLPAGSPLWALDNVIITAHYSGLTPRYAERLWSLFFDNLRRFREGRELLNVVDPELGY
jgi:phosphoglycerate dehydrogenase-like enzyme